MAAKILLGAASLILAIGCRDAVARRGVQREPPVVREELHPERRVELRSRRAPVAPGAVGILQPQGNLQHSRIT